jgi:hypothetical protein
MRIYIALIVFIFAASAAAFAQAPGSGPGNPAAKGTMLTGIIECGEGYTSHELYDIKITLMEVVRGDDAWKRIQEASAANKPAQPGAEYVLARVKFGYNARGNPGVCVHPLKPDQFTAYSSSGEDYANPAVIVPKPELRKNLKSGDVVEGWVVFQIPQKDQAPLMSYAADSGGAVDHGGSKWFLLK